MSVRISPTQNWTGSDVSDAVAASVYAQAGVTTADLTLYVATTGSDVTGNGTALLPYATVNRAMQDVPRRIFHTVRILVYSGVHAAGCLPESAEVECFAGGSFAIVGVGDAVLFGAGLDNVVMAAITALGTGGHHCTVPALTLTADELVGAWCLILDGENANYMHPVVANGTASFDIRVTTKGPTNGCHVRFVKPSTTINVATSFHLTVRNYASAWSTGYEAPMRHLITNLILDAHLSTSGEQFVIRGDGADGGICMDFVQLIGPDAAVNVAKFEDVSLNGGVPVDTGAYALTLVGIGGVPVLNFGVSPGPGKPALVITQPTVRWGSCLCVCGRCYYFYEFIASGMVMFLDFDCNGGLHHFAVQFAYITNSRMYALKVYLAGGAGISVITTTQRSCLALDDVYIAKGTNAIQLGAGTCLNLDMVSCHATDVTGTAVLIEVGALVNQETALATFVGAGGAYTFTAPAVDIVGATWMAAAGDKATDSMGAWVARG